MKTRRPFWRRLVPPVLVLLGLNAVGFAAYTLPRMLQLRTATERAAQVRKELAREREAAAALRRRAEAVRRNAADTERFYREVVLGSQAELIPLIADVEKMATEPGLKLPSARTYKYDEVPGAELTRVAIAVAAEGSYAQLVGFLDRIEASPRFLTIDRVGLAAGSAGGPPSLRVELSAYMRGKPAKERRRG